LIALNAETRMVTITHGALEALDWPAMTSRFPLRADISVKRLEPGQQVAFRAARGADGLLSLIELGSDDGIAATGTGTVMAVTADGKLMLSHDPIPELGWPSMQMEMPVAGFDVARVPLDQPMEFDLSKGENGLFTIVAVRGEGMVSAPDMPKPMEADTEVAAPAIVVSGMIEAVDPQTRMATIKHGPMVEIGMPGMTMGFAIDASLDLAALTTGKEMTLTFARPDGMTMILADADPIVPPMEVSGTINTVDAAARMANITHGPMMEIGMPGMTMDFVVDPSVDVAALPEGKEVTLLLKRNPDFSMTLVGTRTPQVTQ
jgi:Cu(I)/Ag(I) efflux system membrane fusion protein